MYAQKAGRTGVVPNASLPTVLLLNDLEQILSGESCYSSLSIFTIEFGLSHPLSRSPCSVSHAARANSGSACALSS